MPWAKARESESSGPRAAAASRRAAVAREAAAKRDRLVRSRRSSASKARPGAWASTQTAPDGPPSTRNGTTSVSRGPGVAGSAPAKWRPGRSNRSGSPRSIATPHGPEPRGDGPPARWADAPATASHRNVGGPSPGSAMPTPAESARQSDRARSTSSRRTVSGAAAIAPARDASARASPSKSGRRADRCASWSVIRTSSRAAAEESSALSFIPPPGPAVAAGNPLEQPSVASPRHRSSLPTSRVARPRERPDTADRPSPRRTATPRRRAFRPTGRRASRRGCRAPTRLLYPIQTGSSRRGIHSGQ